MVVFIYDNNFFHNKTAEEIDNWIEETKYLLVGSAIFVKGKNAISKAISWVCKGKSKNKEFVPSHVGSLVFVGGNVYKFDMMPPSAKLTKLRDYILKTKDEFKIVTRDFELDREKFSLDICSRVNRRYGYLSALQSAFKYLWYPLREHCSEIHLKALQAQNLFTQYKANSATPDDIYRILCFEGVK